MTSTTIAALASAAHVIAIAVAVGAALGRVSALRRPLDEAGIRRVFLWDNLTGLAALALIGTGLWRMLGGLEKPTAYYLDSHGFSLKMGLFGCGLALEIWPMVTFIRWRIAIGRGRPVDAGRARLFARMLTVQLALFLLIIPSATLMARGFGYRPPVASSPACAVEQIMVARCASCHGPGNPQAGLDLVGDPHRALVDEPSSAWPAIKRVVPGDPAASLLVRKLRGTHGPMGAQMPLGGGLAGDEIASIEEWVTAGAPRCD